jgi:hypothetical protein
MPKTWQPHQSKQFARQTKLNKPYYVVLKVARNLAPYEDSKLYSEYVFTGRRPFTGTPYSGSMDAESLCRLYGPVYEQPPAGIRNVAGPAPQVVGPLPEGYEGVLDETELRALEKQVDQGSNPRNRRRLGGWRV